MRYLAFFALPVLLATSALAQRQTFAVNPAASTVTMTLKTNHETVIGTFPLQSGTVEFDRSTAKMAGSVNVLTAGKTGNDLRDKRMDKEILLVERYATVNFAPKSFTGTLARPGDSTLQVTGIFTLLGTPHELTIPMQIHIDDAGATVRAHFVVPYVEWGLKNPSILFWKTEKDVDIDLALTGKLSN
jgi:polyisoprenoid-binding protein YceI